MSSPGMDEDSRCGARRQTQSLRQEEPSVGRRAVVYELAGRLGAGDVIVAGTGDVAAQVRVVQASARAASARSEDAVGSQDGRGLSLACERSWQRAARAAGLAAMACMAACRAEGDAHVERVVGCQQSRARRGIGPLHRRGGAGGQRARTRSHAPALTRNTPMIGIKVRESRSEALSSTCACRARVLMWCRGGFPAFKLRPTRRCRVRRRRGPHVVDSPA